MVALGCACGDGEANRGLGRMPLPRPTKGRSDGEGYVDEAGLLAAALLAAAPTFRISVSKLSPRPRRPKMGLSGVMGLLQEIETLKSNR